MDLGTGDGRAVLARAAAEPAALVIGVDAAAASMADASRRADRRGPSNALFVAAGVETLAGSPLAGHADLVTVQFPWGSLLRGILGLDGAGAALCGIAAVTRPGATVVVLASVVRSDGVSGLDRLDESARGQIADAWCEAGLTLDCMRPATPAEISASASSWARRLGPDRPVWHLEGVRAG